MKILKRVVLAILVVLAVGVLFRGWFYRQLVTYRSAGLRTHYVAADHKLIALINNGAEKQTAPDIEEIIRLGLSVTSAQLNFTSGKNETDPNKLVTSRTAHCVGYASFFATTCNHLLDKYNLSGTWAAQPHAGQLYFLGTNVHGYFNSPFFKDHDFVIIENKTTKQIFAVDPTVSDYLLIDLVTYRGKE